MTKVGKQGKYPYNLEHREWHDALESVLSKIGVDKAAASAAYVVARAREEGTTTDLPVVRGRSVSGDSSLPGRLQLLPAVSGAHRRPAE